MAQSNTLYHSDVEVPQLLQRLCRGRERGPAPPASPAPRRAGGQPNHYQNLTGDWRLVGAGVAYANGYKWVTQIYCTW
ncbi:MAG: hypothetical protein R2755_17745 [Acidimicrobiales bacterium]